MNTLKAEKRDMSIKPKQWRRKGFVTGNVFGKEMKESMPVIVDKFELARLMKTTVKGDQVMLDVEGQQIDALIKEIDFNPLKKQVDEIDFQALVAGEKVHATAQIVLMNHENVVGGLVEQVLHEISYKALPANLINEIKLDVSNMKLGDTIKVSDLDCAKDKNIELHTDLDATVVTIAHLKNEAIPEPDDDAPEGVDFEATK